MNKFILAILYKFPSVHLFIQLFRPRIRAIKGGLQSVHDRFSRGGNTQRTAVDLGCGLIPKNLFGAKNVFGIDLHEDKQKNILQCRLGFESIPLADNSVDYLTAYDLVEHIPRYADLNGRSASPFIFFMNECYRVLNVGGIFISKTPIYPYL